jgi:Family of unknown function (DUF5367)
MSEIQRFWTGAGLVVWVVASIVLSVLAGTLFASGVILYIVSTIGLSAAFVGLFLILARWMGTRQADYLLAAAWFCVPGLFGEVPVMLMFPMLVASMPGYGAGLYGAFLFLGYGALLACAAHLSAKAGINP